MRYWEQKIQVQTPQPRPQHWLEGSIVRAGFNLNAKLNTKEQRCAVELFLHGEKAKGRFYALQAERKIIEKEFVGPLDWEELPSRVGCRIVTYRDGCELENRESWPELMNWMAEMLDRFQRAFAGRIKAIDDEAAELLT